MLRYSIREATCGMQPYARAKQGSSTMPSVAGRVHGSVMSTGGEWWHRRGVECNVAGDQGGMFDYLEPGRHMLRHLSRAGVLRHGRTTMCTNTWAHGTLAPLLSHGRKAVCDAC